MGVVHVVTLLIGLCSLAVVVGLSGLSRGFPLHDVGMTTWKLTHSGIGFAPVARSGDDAAAVLKRLMHQWTRGCVSVQNVRGG